MTAGFVDVTTDGDKLDNAVVEVIEAALSASAELAAGANCEPEDIAANVLWNAILSLQCGEMFIRSMTEFAPVLPVPVSPKAVS